MLWIVLYIIQRSKLTIKKKCKKRKKIWYKIFFPKVLQAFSFQYILRNDVKIIWRRNTYYLFIANILFFTKRKKRDCETWNTNWFYLCDLSCTPLSPVEYRHDECMFSFQIFSYRNELRIKIITMLYPFKVKVYYYPRVIYEPLTGLLKINRANSAY